MNSFPDTAFAGNIGLTLMTDVRSRYVTAAGGAAMVLLGTLPQAGRVDRLPAPTGRRRRLVDVLRHRRDGRHLPAAPGRARPRRQPPRRGGGHRGRDAAGRRPRIYHRFPQWWQLVFGSPSTAALVVALVLHPVFRRGRRRAEGTSVAA